MVWTKRTLLLVVAMFLPSVACSAAPSRADEAPKREAIDDAGKGAARPLTGEAAEQKPIIDAVKAAIDRRDYAALNAMETEFRKTRSRTSSGIWKLSVFHWRVLAELGPKFDIREFHAQVLDTGALPMKILEEKIDRWIAAKKG